MAAGEVSGGDYSIQGGSGDPAGHADALSAMATGDTKGYKILVKNTDELIIYYCQQLRSETNQGFKVPGWNCGVEVVGWLVVRPGGSLRPT